MDANASDTRMNKRGVDVWIDLRSWALLEITWRSWFIELHVMCFSLMWWRNISHYQGQVGE
jgi:hypothetical protein